LGNIKMSLADLIIPAWVKPAILAAVVAVAGVFVWRWHHGAIDDAVTAVHASYTVEKLKAAEHAAETSRTLQAEADKTQGEKDAQLKIQSARIAALSASLRNRPERPSGNANNPSTSSNCTGAGLYRPDGEFLTWYAGEAARIGLDLADCQARYNQVRDKFK
jgi:hypothetical protein